MDFVPGGDMGRVRNVLIVDDDRMLGDGMGRLFQRTGCRVTVCASGREALEKMVEGQFDIIITDHQMPAMDGVELTKQLRLRNVTAIIIGMSCADAGEEFRGAGADGFFRKPLVPDMLLQIMMRRDAA